MSRTLKLTFGIDDNVGGTCARVELDGQFYDTDGWDGDGPSYDTTSAWFELLQKQVGALPRIVRDNNLDWIDADVAPFGYSMGAGHAPEGIVVTWSWRSATDYDDSDSSEDWTGEAWEAAGYYGY